MLRHINIENFVLIKKADIPFYPGFTVITGDTGAGKSLLVKALNLLLGARAEARLVGKSGKQAVIQAIFDVNPSLKKWLEERGAPDDELIIRRIISEDGRSRVFINGVLSTLQELRQISPYLMSLAGQHEFYRLFNPENHMLWLNQYIRLDMGPFLQVYEEVKGLKAELEGLLKKKRSMEVRRQTLKEHAALIDKVSPSIGEEEELLRQRQVLKQSERLKNLGQELYGRLYGGRNSITELLSHCRDLLDKMASIDEALEEMSGRLTSIHLEADDLATSLRDYLFNLPHDDTRLVQVEERLHQLVGLRRQLNMDVQEILRYREQIDEELSNLDGLELKVKSLTNRLAKAQSELVKKALDLARKRQEGARELEQEILRELRDLNLEKARFSIEVSVPDQPSAEKVGPHGIDQVEMFFSANPGHDLKPLSKVASGGELSRILLAMKVVLGKREQGETLIFDEIDTGIGGEVAERVGTKLRNIAQHGQVIAITHFPQIAAQAEVHIVVEKEQKEDRTISRVKIVSDKERLNEILRMLGGDSQSAREYAEELLGSVFRGSG